MGRWWIADRRDTSRYRQRDCNAGFARCCGRQHRNIGRKANRRAPVDRSRKHGVGVNPSHDWPADGRRELRNYGAVTHLVTGGIATAAYGDGRGDDYTIPNRVTVTHSNTVTDDRIDARYSGECLPEHSGRGVDVGCCGSRAAIDRCEPDADPVRAGVRAAW